MKNLIKAEVKAPQFLLMVLANMGLNFLGMIVQFFFGFANQFSILATSGGISLILMIIVVLNRARLSRLSLSFFFILNLITVNWGLYHHYQMMAQSSHTGPWYPFMAHQLGLIFVAVVSPTFLLGLLAILTHLLVPIVQLHYFTSEQLAHIVPIQPLALVGFAAAATIILVVRFQALLVVEKYTESLIKMKTENELARLCLGLRDFMNTPLQTLEFYIEAIKVEKSKATEHLILAERAISELKSLDQRISTLQKKTFSH